MCIRDRLFAVYHIFGRAADDEARFQPLRLIAGVVYFVDDARRKPDLVAVGGKTRRRGARDDALRKFAGERILPVSYTHLFVDRLKIFDAERTHGKRFLHGRLLFFRLFLLILTLLHLICICAFKPAAEIAGEHRLDVGQQPFVPFEKGAFLPVHPERETDGVAERDPDVCLLYTSRCV